MTCIAAFVDEVSGVSYIAGERGASNEEMIWHTSHPKIWRDKGYLFGYAGSFAIEKLKHNFDPPPPPTTFSDDELDAFMNTTFIEDLKEVYEDLDITKKDAGLLIVVGNKIFVHNSEDMSITMLNGFFFADGSGASYALGAMNVLHPLTDAENVIYSALKTAVRFSPSCSGEIDILSTKDWNWEDDLQA